MWIPVVFGGVLGTLARFSLQQLVPTRSPTALPIATLGINISGSLVLGLIMGYVAASGAVHSRLQAAVAIGFCGPSTTRSAFAFETVSLLQAGQYARAGAYASITVAGSIAAVAVGLVISQRLV